MISQPNQTVVARIYVLGIGNQLAHVTRDAPLHVALRIEQEDATFGAVETHMSKLELFGLLADTSPRLVAFDIDADGFVVMREATEEELTAFRPPTPAETRKILIAALTARPEHRPRNAQPRALGGAFPVAA